MLVSLLTYLQSLSQIFFSLKKLQNKNKILALENLKILEKNRYKKTQKTSSRQTRIGSNRRKNTTLNSLSQLSALNYLRRSSVWSRNSLRLLVATLLRRHFTHLRFAPVHYVPAAGPRKEQRTGSRAYPTWSFCPGIVPPFNRPDVPLRPLRVVSPTVAFAEYPFVHKNIGKISPGHENCPRYTGRIMRPSVSLTLSDYCAQNILYAHLGAEK